MKNDESRVDWALLVMIVQVPIHLGSEAHVSRLCRGCGEISSDVVAYLGAGRLETGLDHLQRTRYDGAHCAADSESDEKKRKSTTA